MQPIRSISLPSGFTFDLILVEGGTFRMGSDQHSSEKPVHEVRVPGFYIGRYQVTQALWKAVTEEESPSRLKGDNRPVERVSWHDVHIFIQKLNQMTGETLTGQFFRLPTEAEWEYAARGGRYSQDYEYAGSDKLKQVGWYNENSGGETHETGLLLANELGLHDMSGNVWEWCEDDYHDNYRAAPDDGSAWIDTPARGVDRVARGGSCFNNAVYCRPASRYRFAPVTRSTGIGFRLVLPFQSVG